MLSQILLQKSYTSRYSVNLSQCSIIKVKYTRYINFIYYNGEKDQSCQNKLIYYYKKLVSLIFYLRLVVLGEARVGKTSLTYRFSGGTFNEHQSSTVDATCIEKKINVNEKYIKLVIWDTAGHERYNALNQVYYRGAEGEIVVYDATDLDSFKKMNQWVTELRNYLPAEVPIQVAGNKSDLYNNIAISEDQAQSYAKSHNGQYFATSAKTGNGVQELFIELAKRIIQNQLSGAATIELPTKIGNTRGALKVDGLDSFNPNANLKLDGRRSRIEKKKKKCC